MRHRCLILTSLVIIVAFILATPLTAQPDRRQTKPTAEQLTEPQRIGYAIGHDLARNTLATLREDGVNADLTMLVRGFTDAISNTDQILDNTEIEQVLAKVEREVSTRIAQERLRTDPVFRALAEENLRRSNEFINNFAKRANVNKLPSGVLYRVIFTGDGRSVTLDDTVVVTYSIRLADGFEHDRREAHTLHVTGMTPAIRDIVTKMRVGDRWEIAIPSELGYSIGGRAPDIGPNEALLVDVKIDSVQ